MDLGLCYPAARLLRCLTILVAVHFRRLMMSGWLRTAAHNHGSHRRGLTIPGTDDPASSRLRPTRPMRLLPGFKLRRPTATEAGTAVGLDRSQAQFSAFLVAPRRGILLLSSVVVLGLSFGTPSHASAADYSFTVIDPPSSVYTNVISINNAGQVVGDFSDSQNQSHGFLLSGGTYTTIHVPGSVSTGPDAINNAGQVIGAFSDAQGGQHGFLFSRGTYIPIDPPGSAATTPYLINDAAQVVGIFEDFPAHGRHAFLFSGGGYTPIDLIGALPASINNSGQIAGTLHDGYRGHGFLFSGGASVLIDPSDSVSTFVRSINDAGQVMGIFFDTQNRRQHGFLYSGDAYITIDPRGSLFTYAVSMNKAGQIVGYFEDAASNRYGFLYFAGMYTMLTPPDSTSSSAHLINNAGDVVGFFTDAKGSFPFLYSRGTYTKIDYPGAAWIQPVAINDAREVVGNFADAQGNQHGFIFKAHGLTPVVQIIGKVSVSVDAGGSNDPSGYFVRVEKPEGATVRGAFLMAASNSRREILDGDVVLAGTPVRWTKGVRSNAGTNQDFFHNVFADVTGIVKPIVDLASAGLNHLLISEVETITIDGAILVVIFDDPNQLHDRGVLLLFGRQDTSGDAFEIKLLRPLGSTNPDTTATMGLGISSSLQTSTGTGGSSHVEVNGVRLSSSAGGEDDGASERGALITVGGIGDSQSNPSSPHAPSMGFSTDDELYDLRPFLVAGGTSIAVRTFSPSNDNNILFAYLVSSEPAAIPPIVPPPGARMLVGTIDPRLPTIVLTHGLQRDDTDVATLWTGRGNIQASTLIGNALGARANVVQYIWEEAFQPFGCGLGLPNQGAYEEARRNVVDAGLRLASELLEALGRSYDQPIHLIGHSLGTAVNTYAATALLDQLPNVAIAQFTALDRPHHVTKICGISDAEEQRLGFGADFFAMNLPFERPGLSLRVDNYFSKDGFGVGDRANGAIYNHPPLLDSNRLDDRIFGDEGFDNSHTGVNQWYRWTTAPNDPFPVGMTVCDGADFVRRPSSLDEALNPCQRGWYWSLLSNPDEFPANNGTPVSRTTAVLLRLTDPREYGCSITSSSTSTTITCSEASSPFAIARVDIPQDAKFMSFMYTFATRGDGDYAVVFLDGVPIWVLSSSSAIVGTPMSSGAVPIDGLTGPRDLMVALYGVGQPNFEFDMRDFKVFGVTLNNSDTTPPATTVTQLPAANGSGWNRTDVVVTLSAADNVGGSGSKNISFAFSGAQTGDGMVSGSSTAVTISAEGVTTLTYFATDNAGNQETPKTLTVRIDKTPPAPPFASITPAPNANGWNSGPSATVSFTSNGDVGPGQSGGVTCTGSTTLAAETAGTVVSGTCTDAAGNTSAVTSVTVKIDRTPPTVTFGSPTPAPNAAGWNNTNISIPVLSNDNLSGVATSSTTSLALTTEGTAVTGTVTVTDKAGNTATYTSPAVKIDKTRPMVTCVRAQRHGQHKDHDDDDRVFRAAANDNLSEVTLTLGGFRLTNGEVIQIESTKKPGVHLVGKSHRHPDHDATIRHFRVGPGAAVIKATDEAGNFRSVACPVPAKHDKDDHDDHDDHLKGDDREKGRDKARSDR